jgi:uncharacterized membrane protein YvlD (DUF360 family)
MTPRTGNRFARWVDRWLAFQRLQADLVWEWRPTRLAMLRRAILGIVGGCLALAIADWMLTGLYIDGLPPLLLAGLLLVALDSVTAVILHGLLVSRPIFIAQAMGLVLQFAAIVLLARLMPGIRVDGPETAVWAALLLTAINSLFAEIVSVSDDDSYYSVLVRRLAARDFGRAAEAVPGLLVVQIDGLSLPVLAQAIRAGRAPVLGRLVRDGEATLHPWAAALPPTTPASQAGILHGRNDDIPGFRWYEKATARLMIANHPDDAAEILRRIGDGTGLLADDGASVGNLLTGDAPRSYLTMATIGEGASAGDERRLRGLFVTTVDYVRLLVLMFGEVAKELYQAERQRARAIEPRIRRDFGFAVERAVTNVALRTVSTALVIEEMYCGAPTIYVDYTGYDAVSHHCGPERQEAIDALDGIDRAIGSLMKASRSTKRAYRVVVLSDHGQSLGPTFRETCGQPLEGFIASLLPDVTAIVASTDAVEAHGTGRRIAAEFGRGSNFGPMLAGTLRRALGRSRKPARTAPPEVVVCSSGSLAHIYFTALKGRMNAETIEKRYPGLISALAGHPGIGTVMGRAADGHALLFGTSGSVDLVPGKPGHNGPLAGYGARAAEKLLHLEGFANSGDLILLGALDPASGEVTGFEELIGSHGGLGGWQGDPFVLCPSAFSLTEDLQLGAPALYRQLVTWRARLQGSRGG